MVIAFFGFFPFLLALPGSTTGSWKVDTGTSGRWCKQFLLYIFQVFVWVRWRQKIDLERFLLLFARFGTFGCICLRRCCSNRQD